MCCRCVVLGTQLGVLHPQCLQLAAHEINIAGVLLDMLVEHPNLVILPLVLRDCCFVG